MPRAPEPQPRAAAPARVSRLARSVEALRSPAYRRFWLGSLASVGGTQLLVLAQGWLVFELSGSAMDLGWLGAASSVPAIVVSLFGGVLADRVDRRRLLMATSSLTAALLILLSVLDATGRVTVPLVLGIVAAISLVWGLEWPARQAIFPALIERRHMMSAVALNSMLWQGTRMVLPAAGGILIALTDTSVLFALSAAGFLYMVLVLSRLTIAPQRQAGAGSPGQFREGLRFIAGHRLFAVLIPLTWVSMLFGTSYIQLMPLFADRLGVGEVGFGVLVSATGVGSLTGTVLVGLVSGGRRLGRIMLGGLLASTLGLGGFGAVTALAGSLPGAYPLGLVCVFLYSVFASVFLVTSMTALQLNVPDELRGRVTGIHGITFNLIALGGLFAGALAAATSAPLAVLVGAGVVAVTGTWVLATQPRVRELDGRGFDRR